MTSPWDTVYDFEGAIEPRVARVFVNEGLIAYTPDGSVAADGTVTMDVDPQRDRPRVEITLTPGAGRQRWHLMNDSDDVQNAVETMWQGSMAVDLITGVDPVIHRQWLARVRWICPRIRQVNGTTLLYHVIHGPIRYGGETHIYDKQSGFYITKTNIIFDFSIHSDGWALLQ